MAGQSIYVLKLKRGPEALNRGSFEVSLSPLSGLLASPHRARLTLPRQESQFSSPKLSSRILAFTDNEVVQWAEDPNASIITTPCPARQGGVGRESKHAIVFEVGEPPVHPCIYHDATEIAGPLLTRKTWLHF